MVETCWLSGLKDKALPNDLHLSIVRRILHGNGLRNHYLHVDDDDDDEKTHMASITTPTQI